VREEIGRRLIFARRAFRRGLPSLRWLVGVFALVAGGSLIAYFTLAVSQPILACIAILVVIGLVFADGAFRLNRELSEEVATTKTEVDAVINHQPVLSFGRVEIPKASMIYQFSLGNGEDIGISGRVIRVPISNAHGAEEARKVHARMKFLPDEPHGSFAPKESIRGEWDGTDGPVVEVDLPGNGMPRYLDVIFIRDRPYPHGFVWTRQSREAALRGHEIVTDGIPIEIEIAASGPTKPRLFDTLTVTCHAGSRITADWTNRGDQGTNMQQWKGSNL
jgi:hypothetical protein